MEHDLSANSFPADFTLAHAIAKSCCLVSSSEKEINSKTQIELDWCPIVRRLDLQTTNTLASYYRRWDIDKCSHEQGFTAIDADTTVKGMQRSEDLSALELQIRNEPWEGVTIKPPLPPLNYLTPLGHLIKRRKERVSTGTKELGCL